VFSQSEESTREEGSESVGSIGDGAHKVRDAMTFRAVAPLTTIHHTTFLVVDENCAACAIEDKKKMRIGWFCQLLFFVVCCFGIISFLERRKNEPEKA